MSRAPAPSHHLRVNADEEAGPLQHQDGMGSGDCKVGIIPPDKDASSDAKAHDTSGALKLAHRRWLGNCTELLASTLAVLALLILVWRSHAAVQRLGEEINTQALGYLLTANAGALCVEGRHDYSGYTTSTLWISNDTTPFGGQGLPRLTDPSVLYGLLKSLRGCGALRWWYSYDMLRQYIASGEGTQLHSVAVDDFMYQLEVLVWYALRLNTTLQVDFFLANFTACEQSTATAIVACEEGSPTEELLMRITVQQIDGSFQARLWVDIQQNQSTAQCLMQTWDYGDGNPYRRGDVAPVGTNTSYASPLYMWVLRANSVPYSCAGQIQIGQEQWQVWDSIYSATQQAFPRTFLGIPGYYSDLNALYAGALGALFGAVALAMAYIFLAVGKALPELLEVASRAFRTLGRTFARVASGLKQAAFHRTVKATPACERRLETV